MDVWAAGCVIAEALEFEPLFPGDSDISQIALIVDALGPPEEDTWPSFASLPDSGKLSFDHGSSTPFARLVPSTNRSSRSLLATSIQYEPSWRPSASALAESLFFFESPLPSVPIELEKEFASD